MKVKGQWATAPSERKDNFRFMSGNDTCYASNLIADAGIGELSACLDLATCDETDGCMTTYFTTRFETCSAWH